MMLAPAIFADFVGFLLATANRPPTNSFWMNTSLAGDHTADFAASGA